MIRECPQCKTSADLSKSNKFRPFCSERCKLIDLGIWAKEEKLISRPLESEDFYEDYKLIETKIIIFSIHHFQLKT